MTNPTRPTGARRLRLREIVGGLALAAAIGTLLPGPVIAAPRDYHRGRNYHHYHRPPPRPVYGYGAPSYVPAPPPVVYSPVGPPAALNFIIPLDFR